LSPGAQMIWATNELSLKEKLLTNRLRFDEGGWHNQADAE
jgi:hypothetical protein